MFRLPGPEVDSIFGAVTVLTGVGGEVISVRTASCTRDNALQAVGVLAGTLAGGMMLDRLGSTVPNALAVCAICCGVACALLLTSSIAQQPLAPLHLAACAQV